MQLCMSEGIQLTNLSQNWGNSHACVAGHMAKTFEGDHASTCDALTVGVIASAGRGSRISTLVAALRSLNWDLAFTKYSVRLLLCFSTLHSTHISGLTFWLRRYVLQCTEVRA